MERLEGSRYRVTWREEGVVSLKKRRAPPLTFLLYLLDPILSPAMIINWVMGYRFTARVYERDGRIVTE